MVPPRKTDRKSTRLNSSHITISYAVFCLKKKNNCNRPNLALHTNAFTLPSCAASIITPCLTAATAWYSYSRTTFYCSCFFFFNDTATTEIYTLSLHDALPICRRCLGGQHLVVARPLQRVTQRDRKSTRLNSSHITISYAVFCLKKKTKKKYNSRVVDKHQCARGGIGRRAWFRSMCRKVWVFKSLRGHHKIPQKSLPSGRTRARSRSGQMGGF